MHNNFQTWHRLSLISVTFFLFKSLTRLVKDALPGLVPATLIIFNSDEKAQLSLLIILSATFILIILSFLQYWFFQFRMQDNEIIIKEGIFKKSLRSFNFEKIQNVNILQPVYFKFFNLVILQIETAGSSKSEAHLPGIPEAVAESLKLMLFDHTKTLTDNQPVYQPILPNIIASTNLKQLIQYGITNNGMFWFFVFISPIFSLSDELLEDFIGEKNITNTIAFLGGGFSGGLILALLSLFGLIILMLVFSILSSIFKHHKYQLTLKNQTLKRKSGLLTTYEESANLSKIQAIIKQTNFMGTWLKIENMILKQVTAQQKGNRSNHLFVIPARTKEQSNSLTTLIFSQMKAPSIIHHINKRYIVKTWLVFILFPLTIVAAIALLNSHIIVYYCLPISFIFIPAIYQKWKQIGYGINENFAFFQTGFIGYKKILFPTYKVQQVKISQSPLQKKCNLANLNIYLASEHIIIPYMSMKHAETWFNLISFNIESTKKNWI